MRCFWCSLLIHVSNRTLRALNPTLKQSTFQQRPTHSSSVQCSSPQIQTSMERYIISTHTRSSSPFYLNSDLLGPDLWHLHTSDQTDTHIQPHTQTRSNTHLTDGGRADSKRFAPRGSRGLKADRKLGHSGSKEQKVEEEKETISGRETLE